MLSVTVLYYKQVTTILSIAVCNLGWSNIHPPLFWCAHALMLWLSGELLSGCCQLWVLLVIIDTGATRVWSHPSMGGQGSLFIQVGVLHIRKVDICSSLFLTRKDTYPFHPPSLVLLTMTKFCEWLHHSRGSLSDGTYWAVTSFPELNAHVPFWCLQPCHHDTCGPWPILCGCSIGHPQ